VASEFDWSSFESVGEEEPQFQPEPQPPFKPLEEETAVASSPSGEFAWEQFEAVEPPSLPSTIGQEALEGVKGLGRIGARGGASLLAAPSKGIGGLLEFVSQFGTKGEPGEIKGAGTRFLQNVGSYLQKTGKEGQAFLKGKIEEALGESHSSFEESIARMTERTADIYGRGPFKGMAVPAIAGGTAGQIAEEAGASPEIQELTELVGVLGPDSVKGIISYLPKVLKEKSGLVLPQIVEKTKEGLKYITPKVFAGKKEKVYETVSKQAETLIKDLQREKLPLTTQLEKGVDVEGKLNKQFQDIEKISAQLPNKIESNYLSDYLNKIEKEIRSVPVETKEQEKILELVEKYRKKYGQPIGATRFYSPKEYVSQFRNINKDAKKLYETKLLTGEQKETIGFYEGLKKEITKTLEEGTPKSFSDLFKEANKDFAELSNISSFENIMDSISSKGIIDSSKLNRKLSSPKFSKMLRRQLGPEGFDRLKALSNDLTKVKDKLTLVEEVGVKDIVKSAATYKVLSLLGIPFAKAGQIGKKGTEIAYGYMLLNPKGYRDTTNLLKAIQSGSKKAIQFYLRRLDKHISEDKTFSIPPDNVNSQKEKKS